MRCYIYLFRHGVTPDNAEGIFSGWRNVGLNAKGFRDAKIVALRLKDNKIDLAFQSSLVRSKQTLKEVLKYHPECRRIIEDDRIIERSYGNLQGKTHLNIVERDGYKKYDLWHRGYNDKPPKGESLKEVNRRVMSFIRDLLKMIKKNKIDVAISAHGNSMRAFRRYFEKLSVEEMCTLYNDYEIVYIYSVKV
ncbi:MAG: histidine phosphatase family protein [Candidatus Nanoarchaeia archaeon]|nr:histidine phosphatase family protein [Candidatus Nanoarchaeia archaeon]MDD5741203.1 histidine phosphatase family protein [Candidatus Nanoarchaeia archaeon]